MQNAYPSEVLIMKFYSFDISPKENHKFKEKQVVNENDLCLQSTYINIHLLQSISRLIKNIRNFFSKKRNKYAHPV